MLGAWAIPACAQGTSALDNDAKRAYDRLIAAVPAANAIGKRAVAVLVFPKVTREGGQHSEGVLMRGGRPVGYYSNDGGSSALQTGAQQFGYALFFMNDKSLNALTEASGFEVGIGPSVVVVDQGMAKSATSITMRDEIYAFIFGQKGLMAGIGLQGNKITKLAQ